MNDAGRSRPIDTRPHRQIEIAVSLKMYLDHAHTVSWSTAVAVGAQDLFWEDRGPYTGAVSGADLRQIGCSYVEVGHVERRRVFGEDRKVARRKLTAALRNGLTPIICVGEDQQAPP